MFYVSAAVVLLLMVSGSGIAAPPKVIETRPTFNAIEVHPKLEKITVTFDQPMDPRGMSVVGSGPNAPKISGKPHWLNDRTLELPVKLEPDKAYWLGFNSEQQQDFKSMAGESAVPYLLQFRTGVDKNDPLTPEQIDASIRKLRAVIQHRYSHRDLRWVDWNRRFASFDAQLRQATTSYQFADSAGQMLSAAEDLHLRVEVLGGSTYRTFTPRVRANIDMALLRRLIPGLVEHTPNVSSGRIEGNIGYLLITDFNASDKAAATAIEDVLSSPDCAKGLIIDLRLNSRSDLSAAAEFAGHFIDTPALYARYVERDPDSPTGFTPPVDQVLHPAPEGQRYRAPMVVLTGAAVMGSAEAFVLMMKQSPRCTVVGEPTYGSYSHQRSYTLECGVRVWVPSWKAMRLDGSVIEGQGVHPDVLIKTTDADFANRDPLIDRAVEILQKPQARGQKSADREDRWWPAAPTQPQGKRL